MVKLKRYSANPVIRPRKYLWEKNGTFNPGAIFIDDKVHILYRAFSSDRTSTLGYASSLDGLKFKERLSRPVYLPRNKFELKLKKGQFSGCEDPRMVRFGNRIYVSYTAFTGDFSSIRLALTSISVKDFLAKKWKWKKPIAMTPEGKRHKNFIIFPEKIKGKVAILHRISPEVSIKYVDSLEKFFNGKRYISSEYKKVLRRKSWDNYLRGAGPTPIKTVHGWLILYHATTKRDPHRFKIGAMLLDLKNPKKILANSPGPLLAPDMPYENKGKPGVVYCNGAIEKDGILYVYYGGGDRVIGVATVPVENLIKDMKRNKI